MTNKKQISLFGENRSNMEIKKHSALVAMNNIGISFQQSKAINALIKIAKDHLKRDPDARRFEVPI